MHSASDESVPSQIMSEVSPKNWTTPQVDFLCIISAQAISKIIITNTWLRDY